jgi:hypothetical protein
VFAVLQYVCHIEPAKLKHRLRLPSKGVAVRKRFLAIGFGLAIALQSRAATHDIEVAGIQLPDHISLSGSSLVLNGAGLRRFLFMRIYTAALYLPERQHDAAAILNNDLPHALRLTLLRDLSTEQNLEALKGGLIANNEPEALAAIRSDVDRFLGYIRSLHEVNAGTVIQLDYLPGLGTQVSVNHRFIGTVEGATFNRALMRIWLGNDPVQVSLKQALLGTN